MKTVKERAEEYAIDVMYRLCSNYTENDTFIASVRDLIVKSYADGVYDIQSWIEVKDMLDPIEDEYMKPDYTTGCICDSLSVDYEKFNELSV